MANSDSSKWSEMKEKGGILPLLLVLWAYRIFGRWFVQYLLYFIVMWYWLFSVSARQASLSYLQKIHDVAGHGSPFKQSPNLLNSYRHFLSFAEAIVDKMQGWLGKISAHELKIYGHTHIKRHYGHGAVIVVSHFGNIELLRALKSDIPQKINILVYQKHAIQFNQFLKKVSGKTEVSLIAVDELGMDTMLLLQQKVDLGEWVIIAADRVPVHSQRTQSLEFFGQVAHWPQGAWILANLLKVPVIACFCYKMQRNFEVHCHPIAEQVVLARQTRMVQMAEYTHKFIALLEQHCLRAPYQWFNFYQFWNVKK